jgi:hypothetical protein
MISVNEVLKLNQLEAIKILKEKEDNTVIFAEWDEKEGVYSNADDCPYIRYANDDGEISTRLVVGVRYNDDRERIEIITTNDEYKKSDGEWYPINWADDISYWYVLEYLEEVAE